LFYLVCTITSTQLHTVTLLFSTLAAQLHVFNQILFNPLEPELFHLGNRSSFLGTLGTNGLKFCLTRSKPA